MGPTVPSGQAASSSLGLPWRGGCPSPHTRGAVEAGAALPLSHTSPCSRLLLFDLGISVGRPGISPGAAASLGGRWTRDLWEGTFLWVSFCVVFLSQSALLFNLFLAALSSPWLSCPSACGILVPGPGIEPCPLQWQRVLHPWTTRKSMQCLFETCIRWWIWG